MNQEPLDRQLAQALAKVRALEQELAETNRGLVALAMELEQRVDERTAELRQSNARLQAEITERKRGEMRIKLLEETASQLLRTDNPQRVVNSLCRKVTGFLDCHAFFNYLVDEKAGCLRLNACGGIPAHVAQEIEWLDYGAAVCGCAARDGCRIVAEDIPTTPDPRTELVKSFGIQAYACHPLKVQERVLGTLSFGTRSRTRFSEEELALMKAVADQVAIAMERQRAQAELQRMNGELEQRVQERTQSLQEALAELQHFSYTITHDMRAPLRAMRGYSDMLLAARDIGGLSQSTMLQRIASSAERMDRLITDALNYSTLVQQEFDLGAVNVERLLREIIDSYPNLQPLKEQICMAPNLPPVLANEAGLTQCFSNLLGNAVKFAKTGEAPQVRIWAEEKGEVIRYWVEDNGIGIPAEYCDKIFGMFQRLNNNREGTGIGLALVKKAAERMEGRVGVESELGKGSRFWLEFKRA